MYNFEIAIVGGGASGLAAAVEALHTESSVCILERLPRVGKKLLATGNGRCNLGNVNACPAIYMGNGHLISSVLSSCGDTPGFFSSLGLYTRTDSEGRIYPMSNSAASVLDSLRLRCSAGGAAEICGCRVISIKRYEGGYILESDDGRRFSAQKLIFACGGKAAPAFGTDGSAFELLRPYGVKINSLSPALAPLASSSRSLRSLKGIRVNAAVAAYRQGEKVYFGKGEVQFGDGLLSGICVLDAAAFSPDEISLDLIPECSLTEVNDMLLNIFSIRSDAAIEDTFTGLFVKRIAQCLIRSVSNIDFSAPASDFTPDDVSRLAHTIKDWRFETSASVWDKAQTTRGGIDCGEISEKLELKKLPGVFVCGEAVDVCGPCGGFNLNWAWVSGRCAGRYAAADLR